jgi:hypothetical protein
VPFQPELVVDQPFDGHTIAATIALDRNRFTLGTTYFTAGNSPVVCRSVTIVSLSRVSR